MTIAGTKIDRYELIDDLISYRNDLKSYAPEDIADDERNPSGDVRLRVHRGNWELLTGDSGYDTDHRGYWGASSVSPDDTLEDLGNIADDLLNQVADDFCQSKRD